MDAKGTNNSVRSGYTTVKLLSGIMVACVLVAACLIVCLRARSEAIEISFDKTKQLAAERGRRTADAERSNWLQREQLRLAAVETNMYSKLSIPDLAKNVVCCLAIAEKPEYIVNKAIVITEKELDCTIVRPPWNKSTDPEKHVFWSIVCRETRDVDHDWWIEQNKVFGQYRLVGNPSQSIYFSINDEDKLRVLLLHIAMIAHSIMPRPFYQVIEGADDEVKDGCHALSLAEAKLIFPETANVRDIRAWVYAIHPGNAYALVPLKDYFSTLVLDKGVECVVLLGKMGAKSVRVSRTCGEVNLVGGELGAAVAGRGASAGGRYKSVEKSRVDFDVVFEGRPNAKISADLLTGSIWHKTDPQLNGILAAQLSDNKLKEYTFNESQQSECDFDFKTAARLLGVAEATLKAEFEKTKEVVRKFHVTF